MATNMQTTTTVKAPSTKPSIAGTVLSVMSFVANGFGWLLVHANFHSKQTLTTTSQKVGDAVGSATGHVLASIVAVPFLLVGMVLAVIGAVFVIRRFSKVKAGGLLMSVLWLALCIWGFWLAVSAFHLLKAHA